MKKPAIAISLLALVSGLAMAEDKGGKTVIKTVTSSDIAKLPAGKAFEVDLTRRGSVYRFTGQDLDYSRVTVRMGAGVKTLGELLKMSDAGPAGRLVLGTTPDIRNQFSRGTASGAVNFDCGAVSCKCEGFWDCIDLILSSKCAGEFWCNEETGRCFCFARP